MREAQRRRMVGGFGSVGSRGGGKCEVCSLRDRISKLCEVFRQPNPCPLQESACTLQVAVFTGVRKMISKRILQMQLGPQGCGKWKWAGKEQRKVS